MEEKYIPYTGYLNLAGLILASLLTINTFIVAVMSNDFIT